MAWNSSDNDPTPGPWGTPGGRPPGKPPQNRGPWGGNGGNGGGGNGGGPGQLPDLDQLIARVNAGLRGMLPNGTGPRRTPGLPRAGGRGVLLLALLIGAIWLATGFYRVEPDQQGVVLRFGAFNRTSLPGLNYHVPWPVEAVVTPSVTHINRIEVGFNLSASETTGRLSRSGSFDPTSGQSIPAESLMLTGDENIIDIDTIVFWKVQNAGDYLFNTRNPDNTVKQVAESVIREVIGRTPIQPALTEARAKIEQDTLTGMQAILDQYKAGVEITQVQLQKVDPPGEVIESFRDVQRANTDAETARNQAEAYRNDIVPRARGDASATVAEAEGSRQASIAQAKGQAQGFDSIFKAYQAAKDVTLRRLYIETMQAVVNKTPTTVLGSDVHSPLPLLSVGDQPAGVPALSAPKKATP